MQPYDNYEISPCRRFEQPDKPGHFYFEVCEPHEADVWTLYGHLPEGGVEAIGDFATREHAEQVFQRITGMPFGTQSRLEIDKDEAERRVCVTVDNKFDVRITRTDEGLAVDIWPYDGAEPVAGTYAFDSEVEDESEAA